MFIFLFTSGLTGLFFLGLLLLSVALKNRLLAAINFMGLLFVAGAVSLEWQSLQTSTTILAEMIAIGILLLVDIVLTIILIRRSGKEDWQWQQNWRELSRKVAYKMIFSAEAFKEELDHLEEESMTQKLQAQEMWKLGNEAFWQKNFDDALEKYDFSLKWNPTSVTWINKSGVFIETERYEEAIEACDEAIRLNQEKAEAWINRGLAFDRLGQFEKAIKSFDEALLNDEHNVEAWTHRGNAFRRLGRYEEALESYDKALASQDDFLPAWYNKGIALSKMGRIEEALVCFSQAVRIDPTYFMAYYNLGNAYNKLDRNEEAVAAYTKTLKYEPQFNEAWNNLGIALSKLGQTKQALKSYTRAIEIKPDYHEAWLNRALALESTGDAAAAVKSYEKFLELAPEDFKKHIAIAQKRVDTLRKKYNLDQKSFLGIKFSHKKKTKKENAPPETQESQAGEAVVPQS